MPGVRSAGRENALLAVAASALTIAGIAAIALLRCRHALPSVDELSREQRHALVGQLLARSPGLFLPAVANPEVGYTLVPGATAEAWGTRVTANDLGYRAPPPAKPAGCFRIVFVGDSWTFGMGVEEEEAFPRRVQELLQADVAPAGRSYQSWTLALPGYNSRNEMAALESYLGLLEPDAVVICPTINDVDTARAPLPNGALRVDDAARDPYGSAGPATFANQLLDSHEYRRRWSAGMKDVAGVLARLRARGIPSLVFFTAFWDEPVAHFLIQEAEIDAPYLITPPALAMRRWLDESSHPTPPAHLRYAELLHRALRGILAPAPGGSGEGGAHLRDPARDWSGPATRAMRKLTAARIPDSFSPGIDAARQAVHLVSHVSGLFGRTAHVLVRRRAGTSRLRVRLGRLPDPWLYPLTLTMEIPSAGGGTLTTIVLERDGAATQEFVLDLPRDVPAGTALDVLLSAERVSIAPRWALGGAAFLERLELE